MNGVCEGCGTRLLTESSEKAGLCASCRENGLANQRVPSVERAEGSAAQVGGQLWWLCPLRDFVCEYESPERINDEAAAAGPLGWRILSIATLPTHANAGRAVAKIASFGVLGGMTGVSRSDGAILVAWRRENEASNPSNGNGGLPQTAEAALFVVDGLSGVRSDAAEV